MAKLVDRGTHYEVDSGGGGFWNQLQQTLPTVLTLLMRQQQSNQLRQNRAAQMIMNYSRLSPDQQVALNQDPGMIKALQDSGMNIPELSEDAAPLQHDPRHGWDPTTPEQGGPGQLMPRTRLPISDYSPTQKHQMIASRASTAASTATEAAARTRQEVAEGDLAEQQRKRASLAYMIQMTNGQGFPDEKSISKFLFGCYQDSSLSQEECVASAVGIATMSAPDIRKMRGKPGNILSAAMDAVGKGPLAQRTALEADRIKLLEMGVELPIINTYIAMQTGVIEGTIDPVVLKSWMNGLPTNQLGTLTTNESRRILISMMDAQSQLQTVQNQMTSRINSYRDTLRGLPWAKGLNEKQLWEIARWEDLTGYHALSTGEQKESVINMDQSVIDLLGDGGQSGQEVHRAIVEAQALSGDADREIRDHNVTKGVLNARNEMRNAQLNKGAFDEVISLVDNMCSDQKGANYIQCGEDIAGVPGFGDMFREHIGRMTNLFRSSHVTDPAGVIPLGMLRTIFTTLAGMTDFVVRHYASLPQDAERRTTPITDSERGLYSGPVLQNLQEHIDENIAAGYGQGASLDFPTLSALIQQYQQAPDGTNPATWMIHAMEPYREARGTRYEHQGELTPKQQADRTKLIWNAIIDELGDDGPEYEKHVANSLGVHDPDEISGGKFITEEYIGKFMEQIQEWDTTPVLTEATTADEIARLRPLLPAAAVLEGNANAMKLAVEKVGAQVTARLSELPDDSDYVNWAKPLMRAIVAFRDKPSNGAYATIIDTLNSLGTAANAVVPNQMSQQNIAPQMTPQQEYMQNRVGGVPNSMLQRSVIGGGPLNYAPQLEAGTPEPVDSIRSLKR